MPKDPPIVDPPTDAGSDSPGSKSDPLPNSLEKWRAERKYELGSYKGKPLLELNLRSKVFLKMAKIFETDGSSAEAKVAGFSLGLNKEGCFSFGGEYSFPTPWRFVELSVGAKGTSCGDWEVKTGLQDPFGAIGSVSSIRTNKSIGAEATLFNVGVNAEASAAAGAGVEDAKSDLKRAMGEAIDDLSESIRTLDERAARSLRDSLNDMYQQYGYGRPF